MSLDAIFATTFTRKAAHEMTNRVQKLIDSAPQFMGTFHRNSLLLIKKYPVLVEVHGYNSTIELIDAKGEALCYAGTSIPAHYMLPAASEAPKEIPLIWLQLKPLAVKYFFK